jgi:hypothetical protein
MRRSRFGAAGPSLALENDMPPVTPSAAAADDQATAAARQRRPLRVGVGTDEEAPAAVRTVRMIPPEGVSTDDFARNDDGSYEVPIHLAAEFERVHRFRHAAQVEREPSADVRIAREHAEEVAALQAHINMITVERDNARASIKALEARIAALEQAAGA